MIMCMIQLTSTRQESMGIGSGEGLDEGSAEIVGAAVGSVTSISNE